MKITLEKIKVGDSFLIEGGGNDHGFGRQIALVRKISKQGNVYCAKFSQKNKCVIAKKHKLQIDKIVGRHPFMSWFWHHCNSSQQDSIVNFLEQNNIERY